MDLAFQQGTLAASEKEIILQIISLTLLVLVALVVALRRRASTPADAWAASVAASGPGRTDGQPG